MGRFALPAVLFGALALFLYWGLGRNPGQIPSPLIGRPAPAFSLPSLQDPARTVSNTDFAGRPWLLNVWATWCAGCREEHDTLLTLAREGTVPLVGLDWKDERAPALMWLERLGNPYTAVAFDPQGRTAIDWGVYGAPETFLVGADGLVLHKHLGPLTPEIWQRDFLPKLAARERS